MLRLAGADVDRVVAGVVLVDHDRTRGIDAQRPAQVLPIGIVVERVLRPPDPSACRCDVRDTMLRLTARAECDRGRPPARDVLVRDIVERSCGGPRTDTAPCSGPTGVHSPFFSRPLFVCRSSARANAARAPAISATEIVLSGNARSRNAASPAEPGPSSLSTPPCVVARWRASAGGISPALMTADGRVVFDGPDATASRTVVAARTITLSAASVSRSLPFINPSPSNTGMVRSAAAARSASDGRQLRSSRSTISAFRLRSVRRDASRSRSRSSTGMRRRNRNFSPAKPGNPYRNGIGYQVALDQRDITPSFRISFPDAAPRGHGVLARLERRICKLRGADRAGTTRDSGDQERHAAPRRRIRL